MTGSVHSKRDRDKENSNSFYASPKSELESTVLKSFLNRTVSDLIMTSDDWVFL